MGATVFHPGQYRFELALAASGLLHALICVVFALESPMQERRAADFTPITVRIEPQTPAFPAELIAPIAASSSAIAPGRPHATPATNRIPRERKEAAALVLPQASDPTYYSARDLDVYPRPVAPLELDRFAADAAARMRFTLLIDEAGKVNEIASVEPGPLQQALRTMLAATRFIPGRKDGRAVKSRVLLDVSVGQEKGGP
jgi:protein TonB